MPLPTIDKKFYQEALNTLKSFGNKHFTEEFLKIAGLPVKKKLTQMWDDIEEWLRLGADSDCIKLLEYVDDLKMWGKQRIYLFHIENDDTIGKLSDDDQIKQLGKAGKVFNNPIYEWELTQPTLVHVKRVQDPQTRDSLLIFKFIEIRKFEIEANGTIQTAEERSTNYFIINLSKSYAELRLQQLPTRASINYKEEYSLFIIEIKEVLGDYFENFKPMALEQAMYTIVQRPVFRITGITFVSTKAPTNPPSTLLLILNRLFSNPRVSYVAGYWSYKQKILGKSRLYFSLYGNSNSIDIGGIADPGKIRDLLQKIITINLGKEALKRTLPRPLMEKPYLMLYGQPKAQAVVLSAGAIAAFLIWVILDETGNYFIEEGAQMILGSIPLVVPKILIEIIWVWAYYGWNRIVRSFKALLQLSPRKIWEIIQWAKQNKGQIKGKQATLSDHYSKYTNIIQST